MAERTIVLDGFSKTYAMTGWRLGFGIMEKQLAKHVARLMTNSNSCTATFVQKAGHGGAHRTAGRGRRRWSRSSACAATSSSKGLNALPGRDLLQAARARSTCSRTSRGTGIKSAELAKLLLEEAGVACLSGTAFGAHGEGYLRFSYANWLDEHPARRSSRMGEFLSVRAR